MYNHKLRFSLASILFDNYYNEVCEMMNVPILCEIIFKFTSISSLMRELAKVEGRIKSSIGIAKFLNTFICVTLDGVNDNYDIFC